MRILVLNYEFPPVGGGGGRVGEQVGVGLAARGHEVAVLTSHARGLPLRECRDNLTITRVRCLRQRADRCTVPEMFAFVLAATWPALRLAREWRPDVIHVHFAVPTGPIAWLLRRLIGIPYVLTAHLGDVPGGVPEQTASLFRVLKPLTVPIWRDAAIVTGVSSFVCGLVEHAYGIKARLVPNGIELDGYSGSSNPTSDPVRLIWCGRIQPQKNLSFGLRALAGINDCRWVLDVVGDGSARAEVEILAKSLGLSGRICFHGWVDPSAVGRLMAQSDVLFMPSLSEGMSVVSVQALAAGLAIVASRIGGFADVVIPGENGFLCALDSTAEFESALRTLCSDPQRLADMKMASRGLAESFSLGRILDAYEGACQDAQADAQQTRGRH